MEGLTVLDQLLLLFRDGLGLLPKTEASIRTFNNHTKH